MCQKCFSKRYKKQREVQREFRKRHADWVASQEGDEPQQPPVTYWRFDDCEACFGRSYILGQRAQRASLVSGRALTRARRDRGAGRPAL